MSFILIRNFNTFKAESFAFGYHDFNFAPHQLFGTLVAGEIYKLEPVSPAADGMGILFAYAFRYHFIYLAFVFLILFVTDRIHDIDQSVKSFVTNRVRYLVFKLRRRSTLTWRINECESRIVANFFRDIKRLFKIFIILSGKPDNNVC